MTLPKIDVPTFNLTLPSNNNSYKFRPFLVKEEKIMLQAALSEDPEEMKNSVIQIVNNCCLDEDFNVNNVVSFDMEYILLNLRMKSVGENIVNEYSCNNVVDNKKCGNKFEVQYNLKDLKIEKTEKVNDEIWLSSNLGVKMKWPRFVDLKEQTIDDDVFDYELMSNCIDYVFDKEQTYKLKEQSKQEIHEFFDSLSKKQFKMMTDYLASAPTFKIVKKHKCEKCNFEHIIEIKDLMNFFT